MSNASESSRISQNVQNVQPSKTVEISTLANQLAEEGRDIVSLSIGEPDFDTPEQICGEAKQAIENGRTRYTSSSGIKELRKKIVDRYRSRYDLSYTPEQVVVTCGAKHAIYQVLQVLAGPDDEVLVPVPYWVSYPEMVWSIGAKPIFLETDLETDFKLTPEQVRNNGSSDATVLLLNTPGNPTGTVYERQELKAIMSAAVDEGLTVVTDEIYEDFVYGDSEHVPPASLDSRMKENTVIVSGFSKTYAMTGWRSGFVVGPEDILNAVSKLQGHTTTHTSSISQYASLAAFDLPEEKVREFRDQFRKRRDYVVERLRDLEGIQLTEPGGAFYVFPDVSHYYSNLTNVGQDNPGVRFCKALIEEKGVALVPGAGFGKDSCVRLSYAASMEDLEEGLNRFGEFLSDLTG